MFLPYFGVVAYFLSPLCMTFPYSFCIAGKRWWLNERGHDAALHKILESLCALWCKKPACGSFDRSISLRV